MLEAKEEAAVKEACQRLGPNRKRWTPGHLISHLSFGFWVSLCNRPYEQGRQSGPKIWHAATRRFPNCPKSLRNRTDIRDAFSEIKDFRNRVAHHNPLWDLDVLAYHQRSIELIRWMNAGIADALADTSLVLRIYGEGHQVHRAIAEQMMYF
jgi:hypothetical protein